MFNQFTIFPGNLWAADFILDHVIDVCTTASHSSTKVLAFCDPAERTNGIDYFAVVKHDIRYLPLLPSGMNLVGLWIRTSVEF